jgi:hypothetical protein
MVAFSSGKGRSDGKKLSIFAKEKGVFVVSFCIVIV